MLCIYNIYVYMVNICTYGLYLVWFTVYICMICAPQCASFVSGVDIAGLCGYLPKVHELPVFVVFLHQANGFVFLVEARVFNVVSTRWAPTNYKLG